MSDDQVAAQGRPARPPVRIASLPRDEWSDEAVAAMSVLPPQMLPPPGKTINSLSVLAHHPDLAQAHLAFSLYLRFRSSLTLRCRRPPLPTRCAG